MPDGFTTNPEELRTHAANVDALKERFGNVKGASAHITQDDQAYGLLCGWISGILEARHQKQDELIAKVEENLTLVAKSLRDTADDYETHEQGVVGVMGSIGDDLGSVRPR
ncbi:WXG100 family type VII secretion target [Actinophytocola sp. NPDC049390]|uniref:WXG100 family type VII secretion target n=1 Tax=Actinophytocola sp. NPDC049390 TaxID=3363894 RepID=UPI0037B1C41B